MPTGAQPASSDPPQPPAFAVFITGDRLLVRDPSNREAARAKLLYDSKKNALRLISLTATLDRKGAGAKAEATALFGLIAREATTLARRMHAQRCTIELRALDHDAQRALEHHGYRPSGKGPFRALSGGLIEYLIGYNNPESYTVAFSRDIE